MEYGGQVRTPLACAGVGTPEERAPNFMIFSALVAENEYHFVDRWHVEGEVKEVLRFWKTRWRCRAGGAE